jgi:serine/threonine-protein kinase
MFEPIGRLIAGKYRVTQRLGGGGVADVYEAVHEEIGQRFAIKILKPEFAALPEVAERFLVEARAAGAVRHPAAVKIFDLGRLEEGVPYLVMELLDGESVAELLECKWRLPQDQAVALCLHVLDALEAAHQAGVVHRDLKPENVVLVRGPGGEPWAKLIDFGIARLALQEHAALRQTIQGTVMGTPYYMAPEQARGSIDIDGRADIYAVGVMLFELVTGKLPFTGRSATEVLTRALSEPFPSARSLDESITPELELVIRRATERRRERRFASAAEFAEALRPLRPELVAVQLLADETPDKARQGTASRPLAELAQRSEEWRAAGATPARLSAPPRLPGRASRTPVPGRGTPASQPRLSLTPPPIRPAKTSVAPPPNAVVLSRWVVFLGATLGVAAVAAGAAALLVVLADRSRGSTDAGADYAVGAGGGSAPDLDALADRTQSLQTRPLPEPSLPAVVPAAVPLPVAAPAPAVAPATTAPPTAAPTVVVRLAGLPADARATLDGRPVEAEFTLEVSQATHELRVTLRSHRPFVHQFRAATDTTIDVRLEPLRRPAASPPPATGGPSPTPRPLANPFGER